MFWKRSWVKLSWILGLDARFDAGCDEVRRGGVGGVGGCDVGVCCLGVD